MLSQQMIAAQSDTNVKIDSVLSSIQEKEILVIPQTDDPHNISPLDLNLPVHSIEELEVLERRILQKEFKSKLVSFCYVVINQSVCLSFIVTVSAYINDWRWDYQGCHKSSHELCSKP